MTGDRVDRLAAELFAAAREERPARELVARVEGALASNAEALGSGERDHGISPERGDGVAPDFAPGLANRIAPEGGARVVRLRRPLLVRGLLAAIVCAGVAAWLLPRTRDAVLISAERSPGAGRELAQHEASSPREARPEAAVPARDEAAGRDRSAVTADPSLAAGRSPALEAPPSNDDRSPRSASARAPHASRQGSTPRARGSTPAAAPGAREPSAQPNGAPAAAERAPAAAATLSNELGALKQIRQELRDGNGSAALALLDRYDSGEYGASLALEASVLRIEALDAVGRRADAELLARRFVRANPDSPLAERAQRFIDRTGRGRPAAGAPQPGSTQPGSSPPESSPP
jgi:hypothetical protein